MRNDHIVASELRRTEIESKLHDGAPLATKTIFIGVASLSLSRRSQPFSVSLFISASPPPPLSLFLPLSLCEYSRARTQHYKSLCSVYIQADTLNLSLSFFSVILFLSFSTDVWDPFGCASISPSLVAWTYAAGIDTSIGISFSYLRRWSAGWLINDQDLHKTSTIGELHLGHITWGYQSVHDRKYS